MCLWLSVAVLCVVKKLQCQLEVWNPECFPGRGMAGYLTAHHSLMFGNQLETQHGSCALSPSL